VKTIVFLDLLSHADMHLPFNEGLLRVLLAAYPKNRIRFLATAGHAANLKTAFDGESRLVFTAIEPLSVARTPQAYLPWKGRPSAQAALGRVANALTQDDVKLAVLGGMDANLLAVFRDNWHRITKAPLLFALHSQLEEAMQWRSRNPLIRYFDFYANFNRRLPSNQRILALELGVKEEIERMFPAQRGRVLTLEHPVLENEWAPPTPWPTGRALRVGFVGHCGLGKGFDVFARLAKRLSGPRLEFHAIGRANPNAAGVDLTALARQPSPSGLDRPEYLSALRNMDCVCLPLPKANRFVASGSIIDAFTAMKPLIITRNSMVERIEKKYGAFGYVANDVTELEDFVANSCKTITLAQCQEWWGNIEKIRQSRTADKLAKIFHEFAIN